MQIPEYYSEQEEEGRGKSPFDPEHNSTAIYTGKFYKRKIWWMVDWYLLVTCEHFFNVPSGRISFKRNGIYKRIMVEFWQVSNL